MAINPVPHTFGGIVAPGPALLTDLDADFAVFSRTVAGSSGAQYIGRNFSAPGSNGLQSLEDKLKEHISVMDFAADQTGATDSTAAFNAAVAYLTSINPTKGGVIEVPVGRFAVNLTILSNNITLRGQGGGVLGVASSCLMPWNPANPVLAVGNDTGYVTNTRYEGIFFDANGPNGTGVFGPTIGGGATYTTFRDCSSIAFSSICFGVNGGSSFLCNFVWLDGFGISATAASSIGFYVNTGSASLPSTNIFVNNFLIVNTTATQYAVAVQGSQGVFFANGAFSTQNGKGMFLAQGGGSFLKPILHFSNTLILSPLITDVQVIVSDYAFSVDAIPSYIIGQCNITGVFHQVFSAWSETPNFGSTQVHQTYLPGGSQLANNIAIQTLYFRYASADPLTTGIICDVNGNLQVASRNQATIGGGTLATNATQGHAAIPGCAGTPTGTPANLPTGYHPIIYDTSGVKLWVWTGAAWKGVVVA